MPLRVALLAGLQAPVLPDGVEPETALAFDLAQGLAEHGRDTGGELEVDLFARRGSWRGVPLVTLDPEELPRIPGVLGRFAVEDALYVQLVLAGMVRDYTIVHCLAPVVTPLQLLAATGSAVVQTLVVPPGHPAATLPPRLLSPDRLRRVAPVQGPVVEGVHPIPPGVDLSRYAPVEGASDPVSTGFLLHLDTGRPRRERRWAEEVARRLGAPLLGPGDGELLPLLQTARAVLCLAAEPSPVGPVGALRAVACGTAVAGWEGGPLRSLAGTPGLLASAPVGDVEALAQAVRALQPRAEAAPVRRRTALARYGRRAMVARYRELYRELVSEVAR